jgi:hypothetical protein
VAGGGGGFFSCRVVGLDVATQLPLLVAVGEDKSVRVWDYQRKACQVEAKRCVRALGCGTTTAVNAALPACTWSQVHKQLVDEPLCCSLHPSGFMLLLGMSNRLSLSYILKVGGKERMSRLHSLTASGAGRGIGTWGVQDKACPTNMHSRPAPDAGRLTGHACPLPG